jgi:hypothetical protein
VGAEFTLNCRNYCLPAPNGYWESFAIDGALRASLLDHRKRTIGRSSVKAGAHAVERMIADGCAS